MKWLRFPRVLGLSVCLYFVLMAGMFGYLSTVSYRFVSNATATEGTVIGLAIRQTAGSQREPDHHSAHPPLAPEVRYVVNGHPYVYVPAHGRPHQRLGVGDRVTVLYDPDHPEDARLRGEGRIMLPLITAGFATGAVVVGAVLYLSRHGQAGPRPAAAAAAGADLHAREGGRVA